MTTPRIPSLKEVEVLIESHVKHAIGADALDYKAVPRDTFDSVEFDVAWDGFVLWRRPAIPFVGGFEMGTHAFTIRVTPTGEASADIFWGHYGLSSASLVVLFQLISIRHAREEAMTRTPEQLDNLRTWVAALRSGKYAYPARHFGDCLVNLNDDEGYNFDRIAEVIEEAYISGGDNEHP